MLVSLLIAMLVVIIRAETTALLPTGIARTSVEGILTLPTPTGQAVPQPNKVTGKIPLNPQQALAVGNIKLSLNGGEYSTYSRSDGSFAFNNVPAGIYYLDVYAIHLHYPSVKIKVVTDGSGSGSGGEGSVAAVVTPEGSGKTSDGNGYVSVVEFKYPGATRLPAGYPIVLQAVAPLAYFQPGMYDACVYVSVSDDTSVENKCYAVHSFA